MKKNKIRGYWCNCCKARKLCSPLVFPKGWRTDFQAPKSEQVNVNGKIKARGNRPLLCASCSKKNWRQNTYAQAANWKNGGTHPKAKQ